jgi:hypothetical protein
LDDAITFISDEREGVDPAFRNSYDERIGAEESKKVVINDAIAGLSSLVTYRQTEAGFEKESNGKVEQITEAQFNFAEDNGFKGIKIEDTTAPVVEQGGVSNPLADVESTAKSLETIDTSKLKPIRGFHGSPNKISGEFKNLNPNITGFYFSSDIENASTYGENVEDVFLETVENVLGEDGVKNLAMKTILPSLNLNISNMGKQMHLPYSVKFDDKFNCVINALGEEINPRSMSTGERKKADFIIIIALLKILKIRYPSLNILFLDEIFSSVDAAGVYEIVKILNEVAKENKLNTWVINHTELPMELFDKKVEAVKEGGFSKLLIETIS